MNKFEEILERNNFDYVSYVEADGDIFLVRIPYNNTVTLAFISSLVGDLSNNGFDVATEFETGEVIIEARVKELEEENSSVVVSARQRLELSAAYYMLKRWANRINKKLQDLEVVVEKDDKRPGRYGEDTDVYIMNPEVNWEELLTIVDFFDGHNVDLDPRWFNPRNIQSVADNEFLQSQGYSPNETYLSFLVYKDPINFNPTKNLGRRAS